MDSRFSFLVIFTAFQNYLKNADYVKGMKQALTKDMPTTFEVLRQEPYFKFRKKNYLVRFRKLLCSSSPESALKAQMNEFP